jgi:hypothetical protein
MSRRREFLAIGVGGVTAGLAGCADTTTGDASATDSETASDTPTATATVETPTETDTPQSTSAADTETTEATTEPSGNVRITRVAIPGGSPSTEDVLQVLVEAQNDGEATTEAEFELKADAESVDSESTTLDPGETTEVTLSHSFDSSGEHTLQVNDQPSLDVRVLPPFSPRVSGVLGADPDGGAVNSRELSEGEYEYYVEIDNVGNPGEIGLGLFWRDSLDGPNYGENTEFVEETREYFEEGETREMSITTGPAPDDKEGWLLRWAPAEFETTVTNEGSSGTADVQLLTLSSDEEVVRDRQEVSLSAEDSETVTLTVSIQELDTQPPGVDFELEADPAA